MTIENKGRKNSQEIKTLLIAGGSLALLLSTLTFAFTKKQVLAINERDEGVCQNPECKNSGDIGDGGHVHHILPQRYSEFGGMDNVDYPENGILLCIDCHVGWQGIHPDMKAALAAYGDNLWDIERAAYAGEIERELAEILKKAIADGNGTDSFKLVFEWRNEKLKKGEIYWDPKWDALFQEIAIKRTTEARDSGWEFPEKSKGNNYLQNQRVVGKMDSYLGDLSEEELEEFFNELSDRDELARIFMYEIYQEAMG